MSQQRRRSAAELKAEAEAKKAEEEAAAEDEEAKTAEEADGGDAPEVNPEDSTEGGDGGTAEEFDPATAAADEREATGNLVGPPGVGEEGGPDAAPLSVQEQIDKQAFVEYGPDGKKYQVRQIRTDVS